MSNKVKPYEFYNKDGVVYVKFTHKNKNYDLPADKAGEALMALGLFLLAALFVGMLLNFEINEGSKPA